MAKIFLTGATGYVGGEVLYQLVNLGSEYTISCLVREQKVSLVSEAYPGIRVVAGDLDDATLIEREARDAEIVLHLASFMHLESAKAIARGLAAPDRDSIGHWIQISGASIFTGDEVERGVYGEAGGKDFDNLKDNSEIHSVLSSMSNRPVEKFVVSQQPSAIKTALVIGPLIYGTGRGPGNQRSMQGPDSARYTLEQGHGFRLGAGESIWSNVHVRDIASLIVLLVDAAVSKKDGIWNDEGIYVPENGQMSFGELTALIAKEVQRQGLISDSSIEVVDPRDADKIIDRGAVLLGTNAKLVESRARERLGWKPSGPSMEEDIAEMVEREAKALQLKQDS